MKDLHDAVHRSAARPEVAAAVARLYQSVQKAIDLRRPLCIVSGRCCRFEEYGHRLFVTTMELAAFLRGANETMPPAVVVAFFKTWDGSGCPFQMNKLCGVHTLRPFGCRMFFCDSTSTEWQQERYEEFHSDLKRLHAELEVPYFYVEWRQALREIWKE